MFFNPNNLCYISFPKNKEVSLKIKEIILKNINDTITFEWNNNIEKTMLLKIK